MLWGFSNQLRAQGEKDAANVSLTPPPISLPRTTELQASKHDCLEAITQTGPTYTTKKNRAKRTIFSIGESPR